MAATLTPNLNEEVSSLEKRVLELEKGLKASLKREEVLLRKTVALERLTKRLDEDLRLLRSHVSQVAQQKARI